MTITAGTGKHVYRVKFASDYGESIWYYVRGNNMKAVSGLLDNCERFKRWPYVYAIEYVK